MKLELLIKSDLQEENEALNILRTKGRKNHYSVLTPVYNTHPYLIERQLKSVISQCSEKLSLDVLYVNDGSTSKETIKKLKELEKRYDNVRIVHHEINKGVSEARLTALSNLIEKENHYIMWVDSDDELAPNALKVINNEFKKAPELDILRFNYKLKYGDTFGNKTESMFNVESINMASGIDAIIEWTNRGSLYCTNGAYCIKRSIYEDINYTIKREDEDVYAITAMLAKAQKVKAIPQKLYYYYQYTSSISNNESHDRLEQKVSDTLFRVNQIEEEFQKLKICVEKQKIILGNLSRIVCISDKKAKILKHVDLSQYCPILQEALKRRIENDSTNTPDLEILVAS